jgi:hypothetical protein
LVKNTTTFIKVPYWLLSKDRDSSYELMTYCSLCLNRLLFDNSIASISIKQICVEYGYSMSRNKNGFLTDIRSSLAKFVEHGLIEPLNIQNSMENIKASEYILIKLNPKFFPANDYVRFTYGEFIKLVNIRSSVQTPNVFKVFLCIKARMDGRDAKPSAFYQSIVEFSKETGISRVTVDKCLELLVSNHLLIRYQTGKYQNNYGVIINAPNIYTLNDDKAEENIDIALDSLKNVFQVDEFMTSSS